MKDKKALEIEYLKVHLSLFEEFKNQSKDFREASSLILVFSYIAHLTEKENKRFKIEGLQYTKRKQKEICNDLNMSKPTVLNTLKKLEEMKYITSYNFNQFKKYDHTKAYAITDKGKTFLSDNFIYCYTQLLKEMGKAEAFIYGLLKYRANLNDDNTITINYTEIKEILNICRKNSSKAIQSLERYNLIETLTTISTYKVNDITRLTTIHKDNDEELMRRQLELKKRIQAMDTRTHV